MMDHDPTRAMTAIEQASMRLQQGFLQDGYHYRAGNPETCLSSPVLLAKTNVLLLVPLPSAVLSEASEISSSPRLPVMMSSLKSFIRQFHQGFGHDVRVLFIGDVTADNDTIEEIWETIEGRISYLDVTSGKVRMRRPDNLLSDGNDPLSETNICDILAQVPDPAPACDCRAIMREHLDAYQAAVSFEETAAKASGVRIPVVTYSILALCVMVFLVNLVLMAQHGSQTSALEAWGILRGPDVRAGQWWRLFTHALLHGGILHLAFNMMALVAFGSLLEQWQGRGRLLTIFLFSVLTGALAALWWTPTTPMLGASGGLFGLLGAQGAILLRHGSDFPSRVRADMLASLKKLLFLNLLISLVPGISLAAHAGGLVGGFLLGYIITRSPIHPTPISSRQFGYLTALLLGTALIAWWVIIRIPVGA